MPRLPLPPAAALAALVAAAPAHAAVTSFEQTATSSFRLADDGDPASVDADTATRSSTATGPISVGSISDGFPPNDNADANANAGGSVTATAVPLPGVTFDGSASASYTQSSGGDLTFAQGEWEATFELDTSAFYALDAEGGYVDTPGGASFFAVTLQNADTAETLYRFNFGGSDGPNGDGSFVERTDTGGGLLTAGRYRVSALSGVSGGVNSNRLEAFGDVNLRVSTALVPEPGAATAAAALGLLLTARRRRRA